MSIKLELPLPHPAQQRVIDEAKRFNVVVCGRRWGKTELAIDRVIQPALRGKPCAWFSPQYKQSAPVWRELQSRLRPIVRDASQQERRLEIQGGGVIEVWSLDGGDSGRGRAYQTIVVDEAALIVDLEHVWQENLRPQLTDFKGDAWFCSTPKGTAHYFHALYQRGQDPKQADWASWQMPTSANPFIDAAEIESARADLSEIAFAQEYEAAFVTWSGAVFRNIMAAVAEPPEGIQAVIIGVDWGRVNDYTVFVALSSRGQVLAIDRFRGVEYSLQRGRLKTFRDNLGGNAWIVAEANSMGGPVIEQLQRDGLPVVPFTTTNASKSAIIETLALAFERGQIQILNDPALLGELQAFEARPLPSGLMRYAAPDGLKDDIVMALAIAWAGLGAQQYQETSLISQREAAWISEPYSISRY